MCFFLEIRSLPLKYLSRVHCSWLLTSNLSMGFSITPKKEEPFQRSSKELPFTNLKNNLKLEVWTF